MLVVITGKSGVGKTTLLKNLKYKYIVYMDDVIKNDLYKNNEELRQDLVSAFGQKVLKDNVVDTTYLGKIVFNIKDKLSLLNIITYKYISEYLTDLSLSDKVWLVEMAVYINLEHMYKRFFDKVVLVKNNKPNIKNKFKYLKNKVNPIEEKQIHYDYCVAINNWDFPTQELKELLNLE